MVLFLSVPASADVKLAYLDSARIRLEYEGAKAVDRQLESALEEWRKEAEAMITEIDQLLSELRSQSLMLSEEKRAEKEAEIEAKQTEYQIFIEDIFGPEGRAARKEAELWQPVFDRVNEILDRIGSEQDYTMIFDSASGALVYADRATDITDEVLEELNKGTIGTEEEPPADQETAPEIPGEDAGE
jgi:outer membrane protein